MEIKVYTVVHVDAGIVYDVRLFTKRDDAVNYRDELAQSFKPEGWDDVNGAFTYLDYNEGEGQLHIQETLLSVPDRQQAYDLSVSKLQQAGETLYKQHGELVRFIREYFSRYDMELPCLEGVCFEFIGDGNLSQILGLASDIMMSKSGIQGILDMLN